MRDESPKASEARPLSTPVCETSSAVSAFLGLAAAPSSLTTRFFNCNANDWHSQGKVNAGFFQSLLCGLTGEAPSIYVAPPFPSMDVFAGQHGSARQFHAGDFFLDASASPFAFADTAGCSQVQSFSKQTDSGRSAGGDAQSGHLSGLDGKSSFAKEDPSLKGDSLASKDRRSELSREARGRQRTCSKKNADDDWAPNKKRVVKKGKQQVNEAEREESERPSHQMKELAGPRRVNPRRTCKVQAAPFSSTLALLRAHVSRCKLLAEQEVWKSRDSDLLLKNLRVQQEPTPGVGLGLYLLQQILSCCCRLSLPSAALERDLQLQLPDAESIQCESLPQSENAEEENFQNLRLSTALAQRGYLDLRKDGASSEFVESVASRDFATSISQSPFESTEIADDAAKTHLPNASKLSSRRRPVAKCSCSSQSCFRVLCFRGDAVLSPYNCADSEAKSTLSREELDALIFPQDGGPNELEPMCHLSPAFTLAKKSIPFSFHMQAHPYLRPEHEDRVKAIYANHYCASHCKAFFDQTDGDVPCLVTRPGPITPGFFGVFYGLKSRESFPCAFPGCGHVCRPDCKCYLLEKDWRLLWAKHQRRAADISRS